MSSVLAPLFRIEERALSIGLWVKGSSKREIGLPQLSGFHEALFRAERVPRSPLRPGDILRGEALHDPTVADCNQVCCVVSALSDIKRCDSLKTMERYKKLTLSLPEALLRRFKVYAASRGQSMTSLMVEAIQKLMERDCGSAEARRRFLKRIRNAPDRETKGQVSWTRDELHER